MGTPPHSVMAPLPELGAVVNLAPEGIFVADCDGRYTFVNEAGCRLLGYRPEEIVGRTILDLIPVEDRARLLASKAQMLEGASHVAEWQLRRKDGRYVPVEVSANILPDGQWLGFVHDISERRAHEAERAALFAAVDADRHRLQALLDTLPLGVLFFQPDARLYFNRRAEELLGSRLSPEGGNAQYASRILYPDGSAVPPEKLVSARVLRNGETVTGEEYLVERRAGDRIPVLGSAAPLRDAEGRVVGAVAVFQDMSERMRMEQAIRDNERLLQAVFDMLPVGVWVADAKGLLIRTNPAGERIWKGARYVSPDAFGQYKGWYVDTGRLIEAHEWGMARAVRKGESSLGELIRIQCFDGSFKTIIHSAAPLRDEHGGISGAIVVNEDITALHEAQEKQRASEQLLRTVIDLLPVGLWIADRDGRITLTNPAGERIWQGTRYVGPAEYQQYRAWWVESGKPITPEDWGLARAVHKGETSRNELIRIQCFDGSFKTVINFATPIRSEAGEILGAVALNEDVTSLQQVQEGLRRAVRDREEILAAVTHDLRNPLSGLLMGASAAERQARSIPGGEPVRALAAELVDITRRMSGMVDDLLAAAVASTGGRSMLRLEPVAATTLLAKAADAARPLLASEGLELKLFAPENLPQINVDADRILRVFANLLDNALKFTSAPGEITLGAERSADGVRFSVANSGPTLSRAELKAMFKPFWQAGRDRRGAGLGLAICRSIVEAHGGSIWADPAQGQRVRVSFELPSQPAAVS